MTVIQMPEQQSSSIELAKYVTGDAVDTIQQALPDGVSLAKFDQAVAVAMVKDPTLANADRTSLFLALVEAARMGLIPDGKQGAIVVFGGKAQWLPMIGGVRDTLAEFGWQLVTSVVYANDHFDIDKAEARVSHRPALGDRGDVIGAYAIARHSDGRRRQADWMPLDEIDDLVKKMGVGNNPAWKKWPNQMREKTVGHRLADDLPLAPQDKRRVEWILNATDLGPAGSARALYGLDAEASFSELPSGHQAYVDRSDIEVPPADAPADTAEPTATNPVEPDSAPSGSSDQDQPEAPEEAPVSAPAAAAAPTLEAPDEEAVMLAAEAAEFVPPSGQYADGGSNGPLNLAGILDLGDDGRAYLTMCLARLDAGAWRSATEVFARVQMPVEYAAMLADRSKAA